ncbi:serine hydrolase [Mucilaginibacter gynuensis]|uniref:Serine hydrolase n=1 Tax=Mucilaginibacter gynuensis TaxID=1302236 RepID=A0ABP8GLG4_9SPHI
MIMCQAAEGQSLKTGYDSLVNFLKAKDDFNGHILVADKGKIVYQRSLGYADIEHKRPLNNNTLFNLASLSKQFTATAIMILVEQHKLSLDSRLDSCLNELSFYKNIRIKDLLTHTSGLPDYEERFAAHWDRSHVAQNQDVIALLARYQPAVHFAAGENWAYSNTAYVLLASIIERVSGISYAEFLKRHIFRPLHMRRSRVFVTRITHHELLANSALGYVMDRKTRKAVSQDAVEDRQYVKYLDGIAGDGGVYSTAADLLQWDRALYTTKLISSHSLSQMFTPVKLNNGNSAGYGFGWGIVTGDTTTGKCVAHNGSWGGYDTHIARFIDRDKTLIVLRNVQNHNRASGVYEAYNAILFRQAWQLPTITPP